MEEDGSQQQHGVVGQLRQSMEVVGGDKDGAAVVRECAEEARAAADAGDGLVQTLERTRAAGQTSLDNTPELLQVLKDAGVVDAGAATVTGSDHAAVWARLRLP